jgi:pilus assembly protein CpaF
MSGADFNYIITTFLKPVLAYLEDAEVTEVMINRKDEVFIERRGILEPVDAAFETDASLMAAVNNIAHYVGRTVNDKHPIMEARLPDGSRVQVILPPCARRGIYVSIRKFQSVAFTAEDLLRLGTLSPAVIQFLRACVQVKKNMVFSGGSGTGKTSLLNFVSSYIPDRERIVVIEDASELKLEQKHVLPLEVKMPERDGSGEVTVRDLLRASLRLRPDRIIVGEVRSGEAIDMLQAMNTGHAGSLTTIHANSPKDTLLRLETTAMMGGIDLSLPAVRAQICSAVDVLVHLKRYTDGSRKIERIAELVDFDTDRDRYVTKDLFVFESRGVTDDGVVQGSFTSTGVAPSFLSEMTDAGIKNADKLFVK